MNLFTNLNILKKYSTHINGLLHPKINYSMFYQKEKQHMQQCPLRILNLKTLLLMLIVLIKKYEIFLKKWQKDHVKLLRQAGTKR
jgi:hypothetical protein